jgi:hypothetical protein
MKTPGSPYVELENAMPEWYDPFPEPQTIPSGWDLSEFFSQSAPDTRDESEPDLEG